MDQEPLPAAAPFFSNQTYDVAYWHIAAFAALHHIGRFCIRADNGWSLGWPLRTSRH